MRKSIYLIIILISGILSTTKANAQIKVGVKAGVNVSEVSFNKNFGDTFRASNRTGFIVGPTLEAMIPFIGLGVDGSLLYSRKGFEMDSHSNTTIKGDLSYLDIPVNLKWKIGIPKVIGVYVAAGPYASVYLGKSIKSAYENIKRDFNMDSFDWGMNAGAGVELFSKLQVGANYSWGFTKSKFEYDNMEYGFKNRGWTISAAFFF